MAWRDKTEIEIKRGGKKIGEATRVLAKDGKSYTISGKLKLPDGKAASLKAVYTKQ